MANYRFINLQYILFGIVLQCQIGCAQNNSKSNSKMDKQEFKPTIEKTEEQWRNVLSAEQYYVLREKGTERPFTGEYWNVTDKGIYSCAACGVELFKSEQKFDAHCGWPSFDDEIGKGDKIKKISDTTLGMVRTEIVCTNCGGHLGHLFDDGPTATKKRYCVNSMSIKLNKK